MARQRIRPGEDANEVAMQQMVALLQDETLPFGEHLCLRPVSGQQSASMKKADRTCTAQSASKQNQIFQEHPVNIIIS